MDYYKIISISRPILARANMGLDFVSGQYGCLFNRCRKYVINSYIHGHFHIGLVIIPRPILARDGVSGQYGGLWLITRPIWKCPCINLYIYIYKRASWAKFMVYFIWILATFLFGRKKSFRPKFQSHLITIYVCLIAHRKRLVGEGIVI